MTEPKLATTSSSSSTPTPARSLVLVGLPGVGKTAIGQALAEALGLPFVDLDRRLETATGMTVAEIFRRYGEAHFRQLEQDALKALVGAPPCVLATGGGAVARDEAWPVVAALGLSLWIQADVEDLVARIWETRARRPLFASLPDQLSLKAALDDLLERRRPFYERSDLTIKAPTASSIGALATTLVPMLKERLG